MRDPDQVILYEGDISFVKVGEKDSFVVKKVKLVRRVIVGITEEYVFCFKIGDKHSGEYYYDVRIDKEGFYTRTHASKSGVVRKKRGVINMSLADITVDPPPKRVEHLILEGLWEEDSEDFQMKVDAIRKETIEGDELKELLK